MWTPTEQAGLGELVHPLVDGIAGRSPFLGRDERFPPVVVGGVVAVGIVEIRPDRVPPVRTEVDPSLPVFAVFQYRIRLRAVLQSDCVVVVIQIVDVDTTLFYVEEPNCQYASPRVV